MKIKLFLVLLLLFPSLLVADSVNESIRVGVTVPLTGDFASYGELVRKSVELAADDLKAEGILVDLWFEDACIPSQAVSAINKLVSLNQIQILAANFCVIAMPAMAAVIERNEIIAFHSAATSDSILEAGDSIFATNGRVRDEAILAAEYAYNVLNARSAGILYITTDFGEDYNSYFSSRFKELGGRILSSDSSPIGVNDFRAELTRLRRLEPDVIFAAHLGMTLGVLLRQVRDAGLRQQVLGVYEAEDMSVVETAGHYANGLRFFVPEPIAKTDAVEKFRKRFEAKYGTKAGILGSNAYDATVIAVRAFAECKKDAGCARNKIYAIEDYDGVSGVFSIEPDGGAKRAFVLKEIQDGKFKIIDEKLGVTNGSS